MARRCPWCTHRPTALMACLDCQQLGGFYCCLDGPRSRRRCQPCRRKRWDRVAVQLATPRAHTKAAQALGLALAFL